MIIPDTKRHINNAKTDELHTFGVITGLLRPYRDIPDKGRVVFARSLLFFGPRPASSCGCHRLASKLFDLFLTCVFSHLKKQIVAGLPGTLRRCWDDLLRNPVRQGGKLRKACLLYTSDAVDE